MVELPGKYLNSQLKIYLPEFVVLDNPDYLGLDPNRRFVNITNDLPINLESIEYYKRNSYGGTAIFDKNSRDIPLVDYTISKDEVVGALMFATGAKWNTFDINTFRTAQQLGSTIPSLNPIQTKMSIMSEFLDETENELILYGQPNRNIYGVYNQPNVAIENETALGSGNFYSLDNDVVYTTFVGWIQTFIRQAKLSSSTQVEIQVPERLKALLSRPYDQGVLNTVWTALTNESQAYFVSRIISAIELEGENLTVKGIKPNDSEDRIVFKAINAKNNLKMHRYPRAMLEAYQTSAIDFEVMAFGGLSSAYIVNPSLMWYVDISNGN